MQDLVLVTSIVAGIVVAAAAALVLWQRSRHADRVARLEERATAELHRVHDEHSQQVDRLTREWKGQKKRAHLELARDLLPALDAVEKALDGADPDDEMTLGIEMVRAALLSAFEEHDIERLAPTAGAPFDPSIHEAVDVTEPTEQAPDGTIAACHRAGYRHPDAVLRPAMVAVARSTADS